MEKAVFSLDLGVKEICQYLFVKSRMDTYLVAPNLPSSLSILGKGYMSNFVIAFIFWKSVWNLIDSSGLVMSIVRLLHLLCDSLMNPSFIMACSSW